MVGSTINTRGRYKCDFCDRPTYKTVSGIALHLEMAHPVEVKKVLETQVEILSNELVKAKNKPPKIVERERVVYRDAPKPPEQKYWNATVFCAACKVVMNTGIPRGQTIENTPHSTCGTKSLMYVKEVQ